MTDCCKRRKAASLIARQRARFRRLFRRFARGVYFLRLRLDEFDEMLDDLVIS